MKAIVDSASPKDFLEVRLPKLLGVDLNRNPVDFCRRIVELKKKIESICDVHLVQLRGYLCEGFKLDETNYRSDLRNYLNSFKSDSLGQYATLFFRLNSEISDEFLYLKSIFEAVCGVRFGSHTTEDVTRLESEARIKFFALNELLSLQSTNLKAKLILLNKSNDSIVIEVPSSNFLNSDKYLDLISAMSDLTLEERAYLLFKSSNHLL